MTEDEVLAALRIAHTRHREPVTVSELGWVCAAEIEWAHQGDPGPPVLIDPTDRDRVMLRRRLTALRRRGLATVTGGHPQRWLPLEPSSIANQRDRGLGSRVSSSCCNEAGAGDTLALSALP